MNNLIIDEDLREMFDQVFADYRERNQDPASFDPELWAQLEELGLTRLTGAEDKGGSGASWAEAQALLSALAEHGVRTPYAEHDLLAGWLTDELGLETGSVMTLAKVQDGSAARVPWASIAERIIIVWGEPGSRQAASVAAADLKITPGENNIGEPRDLIEVDVSALAGVPLSDELYSVLDRKRALVRAISVSAALERALGLTISHVTSRNQFGRAISRFQAVQALVSDIAAESALARAATDTALLDALHSDWKAENLDFLIAVARSNAGHSASKVVRNAHQAHGAIGTTIEHELHRATRAALAWRGEYGSVSGWDEKVAQLALQAGGEGLWQMIAG